MSSRNTAKFFFMCALTIKAVAALSDSAMVSNIVDVISVKMLRSKETHSL